MLLKTYNSTNFFKYTFCEFQQVDDFKFPEDTNYRSKSESIYYYTNEGVYRKSNHWGRVANCRWKLITNGNYKNQEIVIGYAKWSQFYPINSSEKIFFIFLNFELKTAKIQVEIKKSQHRLFTFSEAQKKNKQIIHLLNDDKWAKYYDGDVEVLREKIILKLINSNNSLQEIKMSLK